MQFPTLTFCLFFLAVFALNWSLVGRPVARKGMLCLASMVFYAAWDWRFTGLLLFVAGMSYGLGLWLDGIAEPGRRRRVLALGVAVNLGVLAWFKYADFGVENLNSLGAMLGLGARLPYPEVVLPIGISFMTFHGISYVMDVYRGKIRATRDPLSILLYIVFFPQLVAGPIVRAGFFLPQLAAEPDPHDIPAGRAIGLILGGLFKKVVVATSLATLLVDPVFTDPGVAAGADLLAAAYGYAVQIYCDFSAYTDIATGVALLLGYRFPPNFDQPYRSASPAEFWRRWHISLSTWLREYLYISLGGNRHGLWRTCANLMITMLLGGLWHGARWTFVIWGAIHGLALVLQRLWQAARGGRRADPAALSPLARGVAIVVTFHFVCLTWIFFRAASLDDALAYLAGLADWSQPAQHLSPLSLALIAGALATQLVPPGGIEGFAQAFARLPLVARGALIGAAVAAMDALGPEGIAPFIYFQF